MANYKSKTKKYQTVDKYLASGGEGAIYNIVGDNSKVIKIYNDEKKKNYNEYKELEEKLTYMVSNPPDQSVFESVAWPLDVIYDTRNNFVGFVMPKVKGGKEISSLYAFNPFNLNEKPLLNQQQMILVGINICVVISCLHDAGYVFGDFNPKNISVDLKTGHVSFFDTDSFHVTNKNNGKTYRTGVACAGYVAPELLRHLNSTHKKYDDAPLPTFTKETDYFALAIHLFRLLFNGFSPFSGIDENARESTPVPFGNDAILNNIYCFKKGLTSKKFVPDINSFPENIKKLFNRAFLDGHSNPNLRPSSKEWYEVLCEYQGQLAACINNNMHFYYKNNRTCPYCDILRKSININKNPTPIRQKTFINTNSNTANANKNSNTNVNNNNKYRNTAGTNTYNSNYSNTNPTPIKNSSSTSTNSNSKIKTASPLFKFILVATLLIAIIVGYNIFNNLSYSSDKIDIKVVSEDVSSCSNYSCNLDINFVITNNTSHTIKSITGIMTFKDKNNVILKVSRVNFDVGWLPANSSVNSKVTFYVQTDESLFNYDLDDVSMDFKVESISFDGKYKTY